VLNTTTIDMVDHGYYSDASYQYTLPYDSNLVGHQLVVITEYLDPSGNRVSGPYATTLTVNNAPAPVPEPAWIALVAAGAAATTVVLFNLKPRRRSNR
jgi:hypothetical protein